jgi:hypothetical protein
MKIKTVCSLGVLGIDPSLCLKAPAAAGFEPELCDPAQMSLSTRTNIPSRPV